MIYRGEDARVASERGWGGKLAPFARPSIPQGFSESRHLGSWLVDRGLGGGGGSTSRLLAGERAKFPANLPENLLEGSRIQGS